MVATSAGGECGRGGAGVGEPDSLWGCMGLAEKTEKEDV